MGPRGRLVVAALTCLAAAGCTTDDTPGTDAGRSRAPAPSADATAPTPDAATPSPGRARGAVTIALGGDVHFEGPLRQRLRDPGTALGRVPPLAAADVAVVNLETSVGAGGQPEPGKRFTFSAPPAAFTALAAAGVDVAVQANNHALDFGRARVPSTLRAVRRAARADPPLAVVGIGRDVDAAYAPALMDVDGTTVAVLAATVADQDPTADPTGQWAATPDSGGTADAMDPARLLDTVRRTDAAADVVVVYLHWGVQGRTCPSADQRRLARRLVSAGADVVAGSHTHTLQGDGRLGGGYVAYGLGDLAWYTPGATGVLTLRVRPAAAPDRHARVVGSTWWPATIAADGLPRRARGPAADAFDATIAARGDCAGVG